MCSSVADPFLQPGTKTDYQCKHTSNPIAFDSVRDAGELERALDDAFGINR